MAAHLSMAHARRLLAAMADGNVHVSAGLTSRLGWSEPLVCARLNLAHACGLVTRGVRIRAGVQYAIAPAGRDLLDGRTTKLRPSAEVAAQQLSSALREALALLVRAGPITVPALAAHMSLPGVTVAQRVLRLHAAGMLARPTMGRYEVTAFGHEVQRLIAEETSEAEGESSDIDAVAALPPMFARLERLADPLCALGCYGGGLIADAKTNTRVPCACTRDANAGARPRVSLAVHYMGTPQHPLVEAESYAVGKF